VSPAEDVASCTGIDLRRLSSRPLGSDYSNHFDRIAPLYAGNPSVPDAWAAAIARAQQHPRRRADIAALLAAQQAGRNAPAEARAAAALLADTTSVAVVTGQQAGVFGGPLFTLLKAITAIQLARRTAEQHRVPAVAMFWVDAEDHDWE
jgi:uncharacterized protein YllA (UPF0747 family)